MGLERFKRALVAPGLIQYKDTAVTNAQLLALFATPKTLVAAPPTGYHLIFEGAHLYKPANTDACTINAGVFAIHYTNVAGLEVGECTATGFMDATTVQFRQMNPFRAASSVSSITPVTASPLILCVLTADLSASVDATLAVRTFYRIIPDAILS